MVNFKEFMKDIKKTAMLALVSYIIICFFDMINLILYSDYYFNFLSIGGLARLISLVTDFAFLTYFIIIVNRFKSKKSNVKVAQKFLLISIELLAILSIVIEIYYISNWGFYIEDLRFVFISLFYCWYFVGLFKDVKIKVNNKWFVGIIVLNFIYLQLNRYTFSFINLLLDIIALLYLPYFYRYYEIKNNKCNASLKNSESN